LRIVLSHLAFVLVLAVSNQTAAQQAAANSHLEAAQQALREGSYEKAVAEFRSALREDPTLGARARLPLAGALIKLNQNGAAREQLETVRLEIGDRPDLDYYIGMLDLNNRDFANAVSHLTKAMVNPPYPDAAYQLGFACLKAGDLPNAEKWLKTAVKANSHDAQAFYELGVVYRQQGDEAEAKQAFDRSTELRKAETAELQAEFVCRQKLERGSRDEARAACQKLYDPDDEQKLMQLGLAYGKAGDFEAALAPFERAAELQPADPRAQYNLALTLSQMKRFDEASQVLSKAIERWPNEPRFTSLYSHVVAELHNQQ